MHMKRLAVIGWFVLASIFACADAAPGWEFLEVTVIPRWPFSRSVDIRFVARVADGGMAKRRAARLAVLLNGQELPAEELDKQWIFGEGHKRIVWTPAATGYPAEIRSSAITLAVAEDVTDVGYLTVNLDTGALAYKPMSFSNEVNVAEYKTTSMAFRYVSATRSSMWRSLKGKTTFRIGSDGTRADIGITDGDRNREGAADITLTKDFFFGVFPMTRRQYAKLGGELTTTQDPLKDPLPIRGTSYDWLRGQDGTNVVDGVAGRYCFPRSTEVRSGSIIGTLRARSGLAFDFPTEAQWEYAARAGVDGEYIFVESGSDLLAQLNLYGNNDANLPVGSKRPNAWGIYDLIGCCHQWTTTCWDSNLVKHFDAIDPLGMTTQHGLGPFRVCKGSHSGTGGGNTQKRVQRVAYRMLQRSNCTNGDMNGTTFSAEQNNTGCRLSLTLQD